MHLLDAVRSTKGTMLPGAVSVKLALQIARCKKCRGQLRATEARVNGIVEYFLVCDHCETGCRPWPGLLGYVQDMLGAARDRQQLQLLMREPACRS